MSVAEIYQGSDGTQRIPTPEISRDDEEGECDAEDAFPRAVAAGVEISLPSG